VCVSQPLYLLCVAAAFKQILVQTKLCVSAAAAATAAAAAAASPNPQFTVEICTQLQDQPFGSLVLFVKPRTFNTTLTKVRRSASHLRALETTRFAQPTHSQAPLSRAAH
jgi:hypothetical protein